jgi:hypothetical protein
MGAGVVVGLGREPELLLTFPVGGPLSTLRSEAAGLHALLAETPLEVPLLVFIDSLVLLLILLRWGSADFWPSPEDVRHFDVIVPCMELLRARRAATMLVKVKSHSGLLLNERADWAAELGREGMEPEKWPGLRKSSFLCLNARSSLRENDPSLPRDSVPDLEGGEQCNEVCDPDAGLHLHFCFPQGPQKL